jgi:hypothetical protein
MANKLYIRVLIGIFVAFWGHTSFAKTKIFAKDSTAYQTQETGLGYGWVSWEQFALVFGDIIFPFDAILGGDNQKWHYKFRAPAYLYHKYYIKPSIALNTNIFYSFLQIKKTFESVPAANYTANYHFYGMLVGASFYYFRRKNVQIYSGLDVGFFLDKEIKYQSNTTTKRHDGFFSFQLNAVGARFGNKFGGHIELGYGSKGIANIGLSYRF